MISLIIPTLNERENISKLIPAIAAVLKQPTEIIIVDDQSQDGTVDEVKKLQSKFKQVRLIEREKPDGLAGAILEGINASRGEIIVGMDADFNHPPELLPQLIADTKEFDLVIASRFIKGGGMDDKFRYIGTLIFNLILKYFFMFPTKDNMSGYYAIKRKELNLLPLNKIYQGYGEYHLRLVYLASRKGLRIKEVPVYYPERQYGRSKSNLLRMFIKYLWTAVNLAWRDNEN